jgi:predicted nucleic acid-binding protein
VALAPSALPDGALVALDSAPIIYVLEGHALAARFRPLFERQAAGTLLFSISTLTIAEVMSGPLRAGQDVQAKRYRALLESWKVVELSADVAEDAARFRARLRLKLPDAIQVASAIAAGADALATHDRDFSRVKELPIIS